MIAIKWFDDHRVSDAISGADRLFCVADDHPTGDRDSDLLQEAVGEFLVGGDVDRDVGRFRGDGCPDASLILSMAELDERTAGIEPDHRNTSANCLADDRARRRAVSEALSDPNYLVFEFFLEVETRFGVVNEMINNRVASVPAAMPTSSCSCSKTTLYTPRSLVPRVLPRPTSAPAGWLPCDMLEHMAVQVPSRSPYAAGIHRVCQGNTRGHTGKGSVPVGVPRQDAVALADLQVRRYRRASRE